MHLHRLQISAQSPGCPWTQHYSRDNPNSIQFKKFRYQNKVLMDTQPRWHYKKRESRLPTAHECIQREPFDRIKNIFLISEHTAIYKNYLKEISGAIIFLSNMSPNPFQYIKLIELLIGKSVTVTLWSNKFLVLIF